MCNYTKVYQDKTELDTHQWKNIIDKLHNFGIKNFGIAGGEPLLRRDCLEIAEYCKGSRSITTNGILINEDNAKKIVNIFNAVSISIDGSNPEIYRKVRGVDCFDRVIKNIKLLKSLGHNNIKVYTTINKYNYMDVINMANLTSELEVELIFSLVACGGFNNILTNDKSLREEINFDLLSELISKTLQYKHVSLWITLRNKLQGIYPQKCYATIWGPLIDSIGDVYLCCGSLPSIGNILEENFENIWRKYKKIRDSLLNMKTDSCHSCNAYAGNFEYLQELLRKLIRSKPLRKNIRKIISHIKLFSTRTM